MNPLRHLAAGLLATLTVGLLLTGLPNLLPGTGAHLALLSLIVLALVAFLAHFERAGRS